MNFNVEILTVLVEMMKQGGIYAIGGMTIWLVFMTCKTGLICWVLYKVFHLGYQAFRHNTTLSLIRKGESVQLLSEEVSDKLYKDLEGFQESTSRAMRDFLAESKDLLEPFKKKTKKSTKK